MNGFIPSKNQIIVIIVAIILILVVVYCYCTSSTDTDKKDNQQEQAHLTKTNIPDNTNKIPPPKSNLKTSSKSLDVYFDDETNRLSWNTFDEIDSYGIFIMGYNYHRQFHIVDELGIPRLDIPINNIEDVKAILMTLIDESGQSDMILVYGNL